MKRLLFLILLLTSHLGISQSNVLNLFSDSEQLGDKYFDKYAFVDALDAYKQAYNKQASSSGLELKIAECYRLLNDHEHSSEWYGRALQNTTDVEADYILKYADALAGIEKYDEARQWYEKYKKLSGDKLADEKLQTLAERKKLYKNSASVDIEKADFNSDFSDFSPAYFENGLVFISARPYGKRRESTYNWDKSNYLDIYVVNYDKPAVPFSTRINGKYHEGPLVFFDNNNKLIFTRDNYENGKLSTNKKGVTTLKLYASQRNTTTGEWAAPVPLPFNNDEYSVGHPAISRDGKTIYFVSDMPGGHGGTDLYKSEYKDDQWQDPTNLGPNINTEGNEMFPFLHNDKELFFASSGHGGLGGLDLFVCDISKGEQSRTYNLGAPINSNFDDFGLIISEKGDNGYFSSNREGGKNHDNIYAFKTKRSFVQDFLVRGEVLNNYGNEAISNAIVSLEDGNGKTVATTNSGPEGSFSFSVEPDNKYTLVARKEGFFENKIAFNTREKDKEEWNYDLYLMNNFSFVLVGEIYEKGTERPVNDVQVNIIDNFTGKEVLKGATNAEGVFNYFIKDRELHQRISYQIQLKKSGYLNKSFVLNDSLSKPGTIYLKKYFDLNLNKIDVGMDIGKLANVNPIYFDLGKSTIRKDAAKELDKIVKIMNENPALEIELGSHTDSRGSAASNMALSDKRAKASADYIVSKGIERSRISSKGYGESQLINECVDGVKCSEEKHQENRRTEFKIIKF